MSVPTPPVSGQLSAVSGGSLAPAAGSTLGITLRQVEHEALVLLWGARVGVTLAVEAQDPNLLAPFYGVRASIQDSGTIYWGGASITLADDASGVNPAVALVAGIEGAGSFRVRLLTTGTPATPLNCAILVGSYFSHTPIQLAMSTLGSTNDILNDMLTLLGEIASP